MPLRNFTPHELVIFDELGNTILRLPSEGQIRVNEFVEDAGEIDNIPVVVKLYGKAKLPELADGEYLVVSKIVLDAMPDNDRLLSPDTGYNSVVRGKDGKILGVRRLQKN